MAKKSRKQELLERIENRLKELEDVLIWLPLDNDYDELFIQCQKEAQLLVKELEGLLKSE